MITDRFKCLKYKLYTFLKMATGRIVNKKYFHSFGKSINIIMNPKHRQHSLKKYFKCKNYRIIKSEIINNIQLAI